MDIEALPHVTGEVTYLAKMAEKPHTYAYDLPPGQPRTNMRPDVRTVPIYDLRPLGDAMSLDREGFKLLEAPTEAGDLYDEDEIRDVYYPEGGISRCPGNGCSNRVVVFDHTISPPHAWGRGPHAGHSAPARSRARMATTPRPQARNACATSWAMRPRSCSNTGSRS